MENNVISNNEEMNQDLRAKGLLHKIYLTEMRQLTAVIKQLWPSSGKKTTQLWPAVIVNGDALVAFKAITEGMHTTTVEMKTKPKATMVKW